VSDAALTYTRTFAAPPARVFAALVEGRHLERWFCDACTSEPQRDGALVMRWTRPGGSGLAFEARWVAWSPPHEAAFTGGHAGYPDGSAGTVRWTLAATPEGGTALTLVHETPPGDAHAAALTSWREAWPRALDRLVAYLAPAA